MNKLKHRFIFSLLNNKNGITLVELLAAIVILGILITGFFQFFIQSANYADHNEDKLQAVNVVRSLATTLKDENLTINYLLGYLNNEDQQLIKKLINDETVVKTSPIQLNDQTKLQDIKKEIFHIDVDSVDYDEHEDFLNIFDISFVFSKSSDDGLNDKLIATTIHVKHKDQTGPQGSAKTFVYLINDIEIKN